MNIHNGRSTLKVLGVDPGARCIGWAALVGDEVFDLGTLRLRRGRAGKDCSVANGEAEEIVAKVLAQFLLSVSVFPDLVAIERGNTELDGLIKAFVAWAENNRIPNVVIPPVCIETRKNGVAYGAHRLVDGHAVDAYYTAKEGCRLIAEALCPVPVFPARAAV